MIAFRKSVPLILALALAAPGAQAGHVAGAGGSEVKSTDVQAGTGAEVVRHSHVKVNYTGWLTDGTKFDSNLDRGPEPFAFQVGAGQVIPGWEIGLLGMKVGGKRELVIPPQLAYGNNGAGNVIPPGATLRFEIELLAATGPKYHNIDNATLERLRSEGVKLIDIRRADEWQQTGVVEGSLLLTAFDKSGRLEQGFPQKLEALVSRDEKFMLICRTGNRTSVIAEALTTQAGYENVYNVHDGIVAWMAEKRPVARP